MTLTIDRLREKLDAASYEEIHQAAIDAYEKATPPTYRYSATALRLAVDAAIAVALETERRSICCGGRNAPAPPSRDIHHDR